MMSSLSTENRRAQAGFTLVELAIVLVIVGLLIGGILKGQELIAATRVNSTASQAKALEAAAYTFQDTFGQLPGDIPAANTRIPNCPLVAAGPPAVGGCPVEAAGQGNGDGQIMPGGAAAGPLAVMALATTTTSENTAFFNQLYAANLISGLTTNGSNVLIPNVTLLTAPLGANTSWRVGFSTANMNDVAGTTDVNAHYLLLSAVAPGTAVTSANIEGGNGLSIKQANSLDSKLDDGQPGLGNIRGVNTTAPTATAGCVSADTTAATYNGQNTQSECGILIKILQ